MKKSVKIIAAIAAVLGAAAAVSKALCDFSMGTGKFSFRTDGEPEGDGAEAERALAERREKYLKWFSDNSEDVYLLTNSGVKVHARLARPEEPSRKYVIVCHGYKDNSLGMGYQAYNFIKMGYNVLAPDGRASGKTGGRYVGMGYHESRDLLGYVNFILARDAHAKIVLYGNSMGAAEVMMAAGEKLPDNVKAVVEDCGYTSVWDQLGYNMKKVLGLPAFPFLYMASLYSKLFLGFGFKEASAEEALKRSRLPILMIHGSEDDFVPFYMLDRLYAAASGEKERLAVSGAKHVQSSLVNSGLYWGTISRFLDKHVG